ncbi:MAG TPA: YHS domain-containing protein, partial [Thermoanaerobaculia bacterium]|nr:YHS domain-containing protein [Thermoanaerobaculia bacterium]
MNHSSHAHEVIDPVCRMRVDPANAPATSEYKGQTFYFCMPGCKNQFDADPEKYASTAEVAASDPSGETRRDPGISAPSASSLVTDPVCGMTIDPAKAVGKVHYAGRSWYFCSASCDARFQGEPERYVSQAMRESARVTGEAAEPAGRVGAVYTCPMDPEVRQSKPGACPKCGMALERADVAPLETRTEWTCPMHPEIVRDEPGNCPICGMDLEPRTLTGGDEENPELKDMSRRFWVSLVLTIPLVVLTMGRMIPGLEPVRELMAGRWGPWIELALATPVVLWSGWPFFERAWYSIVHRSLNMFTLIGLGTGVAYLYSLVATAAPNLFPATFRSEHGHVDVYYEAAAVIITLVLLGQVLELRARSRTGAAIRALLELAPKTARKVAADGREHDVSLDQVVRGDLLRIRPGEKV